VDVEARRRDWPSWEEVERAVRETHPNPPLDEAFVKESRAKYIDAEGLARRLERLRAVWPELRGKVADQLMTAERLRDNLRAAGCPTSPAEIGLGWEEFRATYYRARMIRKRYTVLDLATETGILEECVDELFAPGGFWAREATART
jgi:glycerol-1-phosphate dehydrogenase [NAD(P)+]